MVSTVSIGVNALDVARNDVCLDLPAYSPVTHGMLRIRAEIDDNTIVSAEPILGSMHRGVEKLFESRDYRQILMLANRHEWLSPFSGEVGVAELLESALGIEVPADAATLRLLLLEFSRVTSHLAFIAGVGSSHLGPTSNLREHRELWITHFQHYVGSRMHPMITRIGGLTHAPSREWLIDLHTLVEQCRPELLIAKDHLDNLQELRGVGRVTAADVTNYSVSGPVARATGVANDLRATHSLYRQTPYLITVNEAGDAHARITQLIQEIDVSLSIIQSLAQELKGKEIGDVNVLLPKVLRVPEGTYEHSIETPLGIASWLLVSRGDKMPYRLKLRPASLHTVLLLGEALKGESLLTAPYVVSSMPFITGYAER